MSTENPNNAAPDKQTFKVASFEGPLDLLLFLIRKAEINIYDIPIATITEQYLEYLGYATRVDLENLTEFYAMAATLLLIKSKMLLPVELGLEDEYEDPRKDLVEKLIEYQKYRRLSELMEAKEEEAEWSLERRKTQKVLPFEDEAIWEKASVWDLLRTFSSMIATLTPERVIDLYEEVTVNEKITLILEYLESRAEFLFTDLLLKKGSIIEVVCGFLAVLELVKRARIAVFQNKLFGDILIKARGGADQDGG
ncbi:MAG: segregation/condensation protein A [Spirochaetales bacterium]|nr:segregation/condensation protein A [Spirochaetales bacterium]